MFSCSVTMVIIIVVVVVVVVVVSVFSLSALVGFLIMGCDVDLAVIRKLQKLTLTLDQQQQQEEEPN